jgi:hypothetical protein
MHTKKRRHREKKPHQDTSPSTTRDPNETSPPSTGCNDRGYFNGAGRSTLLHVISGVYHKESETNNHAASMIHNDDDDHLHEESKTNNHAASMIHNDDDDHLHEESKTNNHAASMIHNDDDDHLHEESKTNNHAASMIHNDDDDHLHEESKTNNHAASMIHNDDDDHLHEESKTNNHAASMIHNDDEQQSARENLLYNFIFARRELEAALTNRLAEQDGAPGAFLNGLKLLEHEYVQNGNMRKFKEDCIDKLNHAKSLDIYKEPLLFKLINALLNIVITLSTLGIANIVNYMVSNHVFFSPVSQTGLAASKIDKLGSLVTGLPNSQTESDIDTDEHKSTSTASNNSTF